MKAEEIRDLYNFNEWANKKFIDSISKLNEVKYTSEIKSSFTSIRETLSHLIASEWIWLQRWIGTSPSAPPDWSHKPDLNTLIEKYIEVESERKKFLSGLDNKYLTQLVTYNLLSCKSGQNILQELLLHVINHSTYHHGQLATLFRQLDETPPSTDMVIYFREKSGFI